MRGVVTTVGVATASLVSLAAVLCVVALSVFMNGYFAFMRLGGDIADVSLTATNVAPFIAAGVVASIDVLKAFAPVFCARAIAAKRYGYVLMSMVLLIGGVTLSGLAAYGLIMEQRSGVKSERIAVGQSAASLTLQLKETRQRIREIGVSRPVATIKADLESQRQHKRWDSTKGCTDATHRLSRAFCTKYNQVKAELGRAEALASERRRLDVVERKLEGIRANGGVKATDPQLEGLAELIGLQTLKLEVGVLLLIATMIEFVSAFGLYFALGHGHRAPAPYVSRHPATGRDTSKRRPKTEVVTVDAVAVKADNEELPAISPDAHVEELSAYGTARLERVDGASVSLTNMYADYKDWCRVRECKPISQAAFNDTLSLIAGQVEGIDLRTRGRGHVLINMDIRKRLAA